jgi:hypothetical protein
VGNLSVLVRLLIPALSSFEEERENYFVGRLPRVVALLQPWANFRSAFSAFEFAAIREIRVNLCGFALNEFVLLRFH